MVAAEVRSALLRLLRNGNTIRDAVVVAGVARGTFYTRERARSMNDDYKQKLDADYRRLVDVATSSELEASARAYRAASEV